MKDDDAPPNSSVSLLGRWWPKVSVVFSGVLLYLCYPRWDLHSLAWIWAFPLFAALWFGPPASFWRGFRLGYLSGATFYLLAFHWVTIVTPPGWILLCLYLAIFTGLWGGFAATIGRWRGTDPATKKTTLSVWMAMWPQAGAVLRCAFVNASAWAGLEWLRGWLFGGFPWHNLGVAIHGYLPVLQIAEFVGVIGVGFLVLFTGCVFFLTAVRVFHEIRGHRLHAHPEFFIALAVLCGVFLFGLNRANQPPGLETELQLGIVQLNIPQVEKWDETLEDQIRESYKRYTAPLLAHCDLVIWPETALAHTLYSPDNQILINDLLSSTENAGSLLLGIQESDFGKDQMYNSAALITKTVDDAQLYQKIHLVAFGEYVPFRESFPPMDWLLNRWIPLDFAAGESPVNLHLKDPEISIAPLICFEDTVARLARRFVRGEPQLFVNVTNDGWFKESAVAEQHLANARFRCIELRRPMARAANTGVSCLLDAFGSTGGDSKGRFRREIRDENTGSPFVERAQTWKIGIPADPPITFYAKWGDLFTLAVVLLSAPAIVTYWRGVRHGKN